MIQEFAFKDHDEWLAIRSKYIGGSDAGAVIGMNPYKSAYTLWAEKTGAVEPFGGNLITEVGAYLEDMVAHLWERETGKKVRRKNRTMVNDLYPFACANIDRAVVGEKALLEIKTTNSIPIMKALKKNGTMFPDAYYAQVTHYLAVTGLEKAYLAVLVNCRELRTFELERDEEEIAALMQAEKEFWGHVQANTPPAADGSESTDGTLRALYPDSTGDKVDLWACDNYLDQYMQLNKQIKELTGMRDECANLVKDYMKEAGKGESSRFKVSYATQERKTFDAKRFAAENKSMDLTDYYKVSKSRVFKVTEK